MINQPLLLLADEPTGNLDQRTAESIGTLLFEVASEQSAMLICVTHSRELAGRFPTAVRIGRWEAGVGLMFALIQRSLTHYWRTNLAVLLGVIAATAVIGGALLVGDSRA